MQLHTTSLFATALAGLALTVPGARAQEAPRFAAPVRLTAGEAMLGADRLYPSPVAHDIDGDGRLDIVVGDLRGRLTVALREAGDGVARYAAETRLIAVDGKELDFGNW